MGKSLVIKGGNFAANGIPDLASWTEITSNLKMSDTHRQYFHYPGNSPAHNNEFAYNATALTTTKICSIDVSSYVGKKIRVYWSQQRPSTNYTGGCWWRCFASALASGISLPWNGTTEVQNAVTAVEHISGSTPTGTDLAAEYSTLLVPASAVYLIFSNNETRCPSPRVFVEAD